MDPEDEFAEWIDLVLGGKYRIESLLGQGGMGAVFRAQDQLLGREVAIKVLRRELVHNKQIAARFEREAKSIARLDHPGIVGVLDVGEHDGVRYIVMPFLKGRELEEALQEGPFGLDKASALMEEMLSGLAHAHERGVIHRDLKPANVFLVAGDEPGEEHVKLVDFGIAKLVQDEGPAMTRAGMVFGTPAYMSPEQAVGELVDERTDVYATGLMFYEMLSGKPAVSGDDPIELMRQQVNEMPEPLPTTVPGPIRDLVGSMIQKDREARPKDAAQVLVGLRAAKEELDQLGRESTLAGVSIPGQSLGASVPEGETQRAPLATKRNLVYLAAGLGTLALVASIAWIARSSREPALSADALQTPAPPQLVGLVGEATDAGDHQRAQAIAAPLVLRFPSSPRLWRLTARNRLELGDAAGAVTAIEHAIDIDPGLADDDALASDLRTLLAHEDPEVAGEALELAILDVGPGIDPDLVAILESDPPQGIATRDRLRARLAVGHKDEIDWSRQRGLDLQQAQDTASPCERFGAALEEMEREPDRGHLSYLEDATAPEGEAEECKGLDNKLTAVLALHRKRYPGKSRPSGGTKGSGHTGGKGDSDASSKKNPTTKKSTKKKGGGKCRGFGAVFKPGCH